MENLTYPFRMALGSMMREVIRLLKKRMAEEADLKLTMEQIGLTFAIYNTNEHVIQQDLACSMGKDKSAILRTLDSMEAIDLVKRVSDPTDRRKKYLMLTKKGEKVMEQCLDIELELTTKLQEGLSGEELTTFYKVVNHIKTNAKEM